MIPPREEGQTGSADDSGATLLARARELVASAPEQALLLAERAAETSETNRERALAHQVRSRALRALGRHEDALTAFADAARAATDDGDARLAAQVQIGKIDTLGMLTRYDEATALADVLVKQLRETGAFVDAARVLGNVGSLHLRRDRYDDALRAYDEAAALLTAPAEIEVTSDEAAVLRAGLAINRAIALTYQGKYDEAATRYDEARELYGAQNRPFEAAVASSNSGFLHHAAGRHAVALGELTAAYAVFSASGRIHEAARCDLDTGDAYRALNLLLEARTCYERALQMFAQFPLDDDTARAHLGLAAIAAEEGRADAAQASLNVAEAHFTSTGNAVLQAHVRLRRSDLWLRSGRGAVARTEANRAKRAFARAGLDGWAAEAQLVAVLAALSFPQNAGSDKTATALRKIARTARKTRRGWLECRAENALGQWFAERGERRQALVHLRQAINVLEAVRTQIAPEDLHISFLRDKATLYADLTTLLLDGSPTESEIVEALTVIERSRSRLLLERLLSAQAAPLVPFSSDAPTAEQATVRERLTNLRARLTRAYRDALSLSETVQSRHGDSTSESVLHPLEAEYARTLRQAELIGGFPETTLNRAPSQMVELQAALSNDEALLLYCVVGGPRAVHGDGGSDGERLAAFVVTPGAVSVHSAMASWATVGRTARRFRYHLQKAGGIREPGSRDTFAGEINGVLEQLHALLIEPLHDHLAGVRRLTVVPCGVLHGVPFHALKVGQSDDTFLADRFEITYAPSASVWHALKNDAVRSERPIADAAVLVGVAEPDIANVVVELQSVAQQLPAATTRVLRGQEASLQNVVAFAPTASLLHLATHAVFRRDNALFSGLLLADDWLLGRDLYQMRIQAQLVTLSACDTGAVGMDAGEEWMGLARGFLTAGARRVVVSLWAADDAATAHLMTAFYRYIGKGLAPAAALRAAQKEMRTRYRHPYYWAAFCLIG